MASDDDDIPEIGAIFTFGKTRFAENLANKFWIREDKVLQLACGDEHSAVITSSGRLYTFGSNDWGQLGHGNTKPYTKPSIIKRLKGDRVRVVACGRSHTLVVTESGVFSFGAGSDGQLGHGNNESCNIPTQIEYFNDKHITKVGCGSEHSAAVTESGQLYMWGSGSEGQLGLGRAESELPMLLKFRSKVVSVACGYYHTAVVTEDGKLFTFGDYEGGKLGLEDDQCYNTEEPQQVKKLQNEHVISAACGGSHTVVMTKRGGVYTFGYGTHGQLGHGPSYQDTPLPKHVTVLQRKFVTAVSCGESHTAMLTKNGELYTCGDGRHGKLGMGDEGFSNLFKPERVMRFKGFHVDHVACGGCHMLAVAAKNEKGIGEESEESEDDLVQTRVVTSENVSDHVVDGVEPSPRLSATVPPSGLSARDKRRQRDLGNTTLGSSLPPLNRSTLPPLTSLGILNTKKEESTKTTSNGAYNPLNRSTLPTISLKEPSPEESDEGEEKETLNQSVTSRRLPPRPKRRQKTPKRASESEDDDDDGGKKKHEADKTIRPKPLPRKQKTNKENEKENENKVKVHEDHNKKKKSGSDASAEESEEDDIGDDTRDTSEAPSSSRSLAEAKQSERIETKDGKEEEKGDSEEEEETEEEEGEDGEEDDLEDEEESEEDEEDDDDEEEEEGNEKSKKSEAVVKDKNNKAGKKGETEITKVEELESGEEDKDLDEDKDQDGKGDNKKEKSKDKKNKDKDSKDDKEDDKKNKKKEKTKDKKKKGKDEQENEKEDTNKTPPKEKKQKKDKKNDGNSGEVENENNESETEVGKEEGKKEVEETNDAKEDEGETKEIGKEEVDKNNNKEKGQKSKKSGVCVLL